MMSADVAQAAPAVRVIRIREMAVRRAVSLGCPADSN
jgi:hypothetical protein